jgi:hypothetical protein
MQKSKTNKNVEYRIDRVFENETFIIYKRMFSLKNCHNSKRYFEVLRCGDFTGRQWRAWPSVKKYWKSLQENKP